MQLKALGLCIALSSIATHVSAAPIVMSGDYVKTAVGDNGTLGSGAKNPPGLLHDASGTGTFGTCLLYTSPSPRDA